MLHHRTLIGTLAALVLAGTEVSGQSTEPGRGMDWTRDSVMEDALEEMDAHLVDGFERQTAVSAAADPEQLHERMLAIYAGDMRAPVQEVGAGPKHGTLRRKQTYGENTAATLSGDGSLRYGIMGVLLIVLLAAVWHRSTDRPLLFLKR